MSTILKFQYFITRTCAPSLGRGGVAGTLPILYVFLARLGYNILDVAAVKSPAEGVKITFRDPARAQTQTLYYFKTDLSGSGSSSFLKWCAARGPGLSLLKAASFLMHGDGSMACGIFSSNIAASSYRTILEYRCALFQKGGASVSMVATSSITRPSPSIINRIWKRFISATRHRSWDSPLGIIGRKRPA